MKITPLHYFKCLMLVFLAAVPFSIAQNNFDVQLDSLDKQLLVVTGNTELTEQVVNAVAKGLKLLPSAVKQRFITFGVTVAVTPTLEQLTNVSGGSEYETRNKRVIICERTSDGTRSDLTRLHITTLHELGHAYDHMLAYPSRGSEFQEAYDSEAPRVPEKDRAVLSHFLQQGGKGRSECFASLFACRYYVGSDRRLTALKADFPGCFALMQRY